MIATNRCLRGVAIVLLAVLPACEPGRTEYAANGRRSGHGPRIDKLGEGRWTLFDQRGARMAAGCLAGGKLGGLWKRFHADGTLAERSHLLGGVRDGPAATFYPDGTRESSGSYRNDQREGAWVFWKPTGEVDETRTGAYRGGVMGR